MVERQISRTALVGSCPGNVPVVSRTPREVALQLCRAFGHDQGVHNVLWPLISRQTRSAMYHPKLDVQILEGDPKFSI